MPMPVKDWWFIVILFSAIIPSLDGFWNLTQYKDENGRRIPFSERLKTFKKAFDMHDQMYKIGGTFEGAIKRGIHPLVALQIKGEKEEANNPDIFKAAEAGKNEEVDSLLKKGTSPNIIATGGWTPLMIACANGHLDTVRLLLKYGADPNVKNSLGVSSLHFAARYGRTELAKLLIEYGADVNILDFYQSSPLFCSAIIGDIKTAQLLIESGINVNCKDRNGKTALDYCVENRHGDLAKLLRKHSIKNK
jgi:hypothetical protein